VLTEDDLAAHAHGLTEVFCLWRYYPPGRDDVLHLLRFCEIADADAVLNYALARGILVAVDDTFTLGPAARARVVRDP
jgi:hypothetical protein